MVLDGDWLLLDGDWLELEDDGIELDWLLEDDGELLDDVSLEVELDVLDEGDALEALEPDWPHLSIAAWVFGPRMPSIGPGLQPCAFSCLERASASGVVVGTSAADRGARVRFVV